MALPMPRQSGKSARPIDGRRLALALVLLVALAFRALIPAGWMPNLQGVGGAPLVICTAQGAETLFPDAQAHPGKPHSDPRRDGCPFAVQALASGPPPIHVSVQLAFVIAAASQPSNPAVPVAPRRRGETNPRAPPTQV